MTELILPEFIGFPKLSRLSRNMIITEKIDGTNAQIHIDENGVITAGSRNRWLTVGNDNFGFAGWVKANEDELRKLGKGRHFGEWCGLGIQRGYGLREKRFYLFNTHKWNDDSVRPACCHVVPTLCNWTFDTNTIDAVLENLKVSGSYIAPFMNPEGIVIYHTVSGTMFKKTLDNDETPKSLVRE